MVIEGDALFKSLTVGEKFADDIEMNTVDSSAYAAQGGRAAVNIGLAEVAKKGWGRAFLSHDSAALGQFGNAWSTGPTAAGQQYLGNLFGSAWYATNATATTRG